MTSVLLRHHVPVPDDVTLSAVEAPTQEINREDRSWYRDAVIYQLHIKAFKDSDNDGIGDFRGLLSQLDYIQQLGVTAIWLLPFYPSPLRDDGYDISDYTSVHPAYGTLDDFKRFLDAAHERGIRVITELVINHTSDTHAWFQRARRAPPGSPERDMYVWSDTEDRYQGTRIIFLDTESSNWTWDPVAKAYFWHRFYSHQPDLNYNSPLVFEEVIRAMNFWLDLGVDGLRLDAVPYLCEREGTNNENLPETHAVLKRIRAEIEARYPDRMLLAEANQWPEDTRPYFGDGDECHMAFHFPLMPRMYMALAQEDRHPITDIMRQTPEVPDGCQWALFLRNHDELTLEMVTAEERDYLWRTYAVDPRARINLGIRRRLATLMENDRRKIELMNVLLMSMPGTPVIYYGDEIGMGDNFYLGDRDGVRTPMQWSLDRNAGFSRADPQRLYLPVLMDPIYGYQTVNVEGQQSHVSSLLNWMRRMVTVRKRHSAFGRGSLEFLYPSNRRIIAFLRETEDERLLCVVNLSRSPQAVELDLQQYRGMVPVELTAGASFPPIGSAPYVLTLPAYGYYWFALADAAALPRWHSPTPEPLPELITLVVGEDWRSLFTDREGSYLERNLLKAYLPRQRWFGAKNESIERISVKPLAQLGGMEHLLVNVNVDYTEGARQTYALPLMINWASHSELTPSQRAFSLAKVRRGARVGTLIDGATEEAFFAALAERLGGGSSIQTETGEIVFSPSPAMGEVSPPEAVKVLHIEQSNAAAVVGESVLLKVYRRVEEGMQPEIEIGRFLTEHAAFPHVPKLLGAIEHVAGDARTALAGAFQFVHNQGDAWYVLTDALERLLEECGLNMRSCDLPELAFPLDIARLIGKRTAELHVALATPTDNVDFAAEQVEADDIARWISDSEAEADRAFEALASAPPSGMSQSSRECIDLLQSHHDEIRSLLGRYRGLAPSGQKIRHHGDFHLGQVLVVQDDIMIVDFEGEPTRTLAERRRKTSPLRDLAGMLRSLDYAAWAALDKVVARGAANPEVMRQLAFLWRDRAVRDCITAYTETAATHAFHPTDAETARGLLNVFLLRKALYEVHYEVGSRPDWLSIPVRGIVALLDQFGGEA
jgi:maltose alpha-D-glucosyltransferase / alpha-amylase